MKRVLTIILASIALFAKAQTDNISKAQNYIVVLHLTEKYKQASAWDDSASARVTRHFNNLKQLRDEGVLYLAGRTQYEESDPKLFGIYIFKAASMDVATNIMNRLLCIDFE